MRERLKRPYMTAELQRFLLPGEKKDLGSKRIDDTKGGQFVFLQFPFLTRK
jgi:hypothetical protein